MSGDETVHLSKHEAVVDRDWLEGIGELLVKAGHDKIGKECIEIGNNYGDDDDEDEQQIVSNTNVTDNYTCTNCRKYPGEIFISANNWMCYECYNKQQPKHKPRKVPSYAHHVLGLPAEATQSEIKKRFRELSRQLHPDVTQGDVFKTAQFKDILDAYKELTDS